MYFDRFHAQYYDRVKEEAAEARRAAKEKEGWKPWMRKAKRQPPEGGLCPACRTKRSLTGECLCG